MSEAPAINLHSQGRKPTSLLHIGLTGTPATTVKPSTAFKSGSSAIKLLALIACLTLLFAGAIALLQPDGAAAGAIQKAADGRSFISLVDTPLRGTAVPVISTDGTSTSVTSHPPTMVKSSLLLLHVAGLVAGLGSAFLIDLYFLRYFYRHCVGPEAVSLLTLGGWLVAFGLLLLWISGIGFLAFYWLYDPSKLANPKIWAKVTVVLALTINGFYIHTVLQPLFRRFTGRPLLLGAPPGDALVLLIPGILSASAWLFAMSLGLIRELNFTISSERLIWAYIALFAAMLAAALLFHSLQRSPNSKRASRHSHQARYQTHDNLLATDRQDREKAGACR